MTFEEQVKELLAAQQELAQAPPEDPALAAKQQAFDHLRGAYPHAYQYLFEFRQPKAKARLPPEN